MKDINKQRELFVKGMFLFFVILYLLRLFYLQVIDGTYKTQANRNSVKKINVEPTRGLIYDRNGKIMVLNQPIYDIMIIPNEVKSFDTLKFCELLKISKETVMEKLSFYYKRENRYYAYVPNVFLKQVGSNQYAQFEEYLYKFPGFYGEVRTVRYYPYSSAAHVLGDLGEVDQKQIEKSGNYYIPGDYAGKGGLELRYDKELRGVKGKKQVFVDNMQNIQGPVADGKLDTSPVIGTSLVSTLDSRIQQYAEELMQNKKGSVVAIEPATGEILAFVSAPSFDPNLLVGRYRGNNFSQLAQDSTKPLLVRPIMGQYSPGSTFKSVIALAGMQTGGVTWDWGYPCGGGYHLPGLFLKCSHGHPSAGDVMTGLQHSCNPYFWQTFRNSLDRPGTKYNSFEEAYVAWYNIMLSFGLGKKLGIDIPGEKSGRIPSAEYYNKMYGKGRWGSATIISLGIGQGEIELTPLQMANVYAIIANRGYYIDPHLVKAFVKPGGSIEKNPECKRHNTMVNPEYYDYVVEGLFRVVDAGTAARSKIQGVSMCGKTGTVQNSQGENHSIFSGFAPRDNSKIAIAVVVENAGYGGQYAAPIASLIIEKYLNDTIATSRLPIEKKMMETKILGNKGASTN